MPSPSVALLRTQSDDRLASLAAAGHERAFEAIVERHRRPLLRHCRRYLPEARAEDALQQALVAAWTALRRGDEVRALRPWLHRIVHNTALNALRAAGYDYEQLHDLLVPDHVTGEPEELAERRAVVHRTLAGLAALPERQRAALLQIAVEGRSQEEVADDLGLSQGAVRQLVHRARTALRTAATAAVPLPLASWVATAGGERGDLAGRLGELATGAGAGTTLAKAGTVAVLAGGAVGGPAVVTRIDDAQVPRAAAALDRERERVAEGAGAPSATAPAAATPSPVRVTAPAAGTGSAEPHRRDAGAPEGERRDRRGEGGDDEDRVTRPVSRDRPARGSPGDDEDGEDRDEPDRDSDGGRDRDGTSDHDDDEHEEPEDAPEPAETPSETPEPEDGEEDADEDGAASEYLDSAPDSPGWDTDGGEEPSDTEHESEH